MNRQLESRCKAHPDAFDCPDPSTTAPRRASTTTPQQALALANSELTHTHALLVTDSLLARGGAADPEALESVRARIGEIDRLRGAGKPLNLDDNPFEDPASAMVNRMLKEEGFRVILSGNARRFDYETTIIVTYDESEEGQALAERARELLGVGEVQISAQHQGSVDLTIVLGKDFLRAR